MDFYPCPPGLGIHLPERASRPRNARVIHQDIHRPELLFGLAYYPLHRLLIRHVCRESEGVPACVRNPHDGFRELLPRARHDRHGCPPRGEGLRHRPPDPSTTASDDGDLACQWLLHTPWVEAHHPFLCGSCWIPGSYTPCIPTTTLLQAYFLP